MNTTPENRVQISTFTPSGQSPDEVMVNGERGFLVAGEDGAVRFQPGHERVGEEAKVDA